MASIACVKGAYKEDPLPARFVAQLVGEGRDFGMALGLARAAHFAPARAILMHY